MHQNSSVVIPNIYRSCRFTACWTGGAQTYGVLIPPAFLELCSCSVTTVFPALSMDFTFIVLCAICYVLCFIFNGIKGVTLTLIAITGHQGASRL